MKTGFLFFAAAKKKQVWKRSHGEEIRNGGPRKEN